QTPPRTRKTTLLLSYNKVSCPRLCIELARLFSSSRVLEFSSSRFLDEQDGRCEQFVQSRGQCAEILQDRGGLLDDFLLPCESRVHGIQSRVGGRQRGRVVEPRRDQVQKRSAQALAGHEELRAAGLRQARVHRVVETSVDDLRQPHPVAFRSGHRLSKKKVETRGDPTRTGTDSDRSGASAEKHGSKSVSIRDESDPCLSVTPQRR